MLPTRKKRKTTHPAAAPNTPGALPLAAPLIPKRKTAHTQQKETPPLPAPFDLPQGAEQAFVNSHLEHQQFTFDLTLDASTEATLAEVKQMLLDTAGRDKSKAQLGLKSTDEFCFVESREELDKTPLPGITSVFLTIVVRSPKLSLAERMAGIQPDKTLWFQASFNRIDWRITKDRILNTLKPPPLTILSSGPISITRIVLDHLLSQTTNPQVVLREPTQVHFLKRDGDARRQRKSRAKKAGEAGEKVGPDIKAILNKA